MRTMHTPSAITLAVVTIALSATAGRAQSANAASAWSPWIGCWHADNANAGDALCIVPDGAGVRMVTVVNGVADQESRVVADGRAHAVEQGDCNGSEQASWSSDHRRVYLNSRLNCGDAERNSSGLMVFSDASHWLSVQSITSDDHVSTRSVRYSLDQSSEIPGSIATALRTADRTAAMPDPLTEDEVSEAAGMIDDAAVQEWLRVTGAPFALANASDAQAAPTGSALEMLAGSSNRTEVVTRVVERPVYVHTYVNLGYRYWSPWGYDLFGWRVYSPIVVVRSPHYYTSWPSRVIHYDYDRYRAPVIRYVNHDHDDHDWHDGRSGSVTRNGYSHESRSSHNDDDHHVRDDGHRSSDNNYRSTQSRSASSSHDSSTSHRSSSSTNSVNSHRSAHHR